MPNMAELKQSCEKKSSELKNTLNRRLDSKRLSNWLLGRRMQRVGAFDPGVETRGWPALSLGDDQVSASNRRARRFGLPKVVTVEKPARHAIAWISWRVNQVLFSGTWPYWVRAA